jgi:ubiquinone/menaquinone biosynthesis C-methylase UbiE
MLVIRRFSRGRNVFVKSFRNDICLTLTGGLMLLMSHVGLAQENQSDGIAELQKAIESDGDSQAEPAAEETEQTPKKIAKQVPKGLDIYMGRRIARTMHYAGAEWLIRDEREREERCSLMLANLGVRPGITVCDMGCGNGFHSLPIAKMVGKDGLVVGVDVQPEMLGFLRDRTEEQGIENVVPILGSYHNPRLPPDSIDLVLMVDVYHEFSHPEHMLAAIRKSLKPGGLVVLVEYREEDKKVPIKPLHKMSKLQVNKELVANGFKLAKEFDGLPWQHMMFFGIDQEQDAASTDSPEPTPPESKIEESTTESEKN